MKQFTITIPDNKESIFIEWMKSISFVKNIEEVPVIDIPEEQKKIVRQRIQRMEANPESGLTWDHIESKIKLD